MFNAFMMLFIIHGVQTGVGLLGLPRLLYSFVEQDGWIVLPFTGIFIAIIIWSMIGTLKQYKSADLYGIQADVFGSFLGTLINLLYILYLLLISFVLVMNYTEIIQTWLFQQIPGWLPVVLLMFLSIYAVLGGIRVVVGISLFSVLLTFWLIFMLYSPMQYIESTRYFPLWNHSILDMGKAIYKTSFSILGIETLYFFYPYIRDKEKALKYTQISSAYTIFVNTLVTAVCIGFFSGEYLIQTIWPVLTMFSIVRIPNLERFEFIAIAFWMILILPNMCTYLWASTKGVKRVFGFSQKKTLYAFSLLIFIGSFMIEKRITMNKVTDIAGMLGFYLTYCYPLLLFMLVKWKKRKKGKK